MPANKVKLSQSVGLDRSLNIPIELNWDYLNVGDSIELYEQGVIAEVLGDGRDFEVTRFANQPYSGTSSGVTEINYKFYFYSGGSLTNQLNWQPNYLAEGFSTQDIYYYNNNFANSFFKLDFYDNNDEKRQTNYFTLIIPTQQGLVTSAIMQRTNVTIKKPEFVLDYVGDKEGYFIYWLKSREFLDITDFWMTAKFYNAEKGYFVKMMNEGQWNLAQAGTPYMFDISNYLYLPVKLDYPTQTYQVFNQVRQRLGDAANPINWYEYVNPPQ
jgi:hypothetical protein